MPAQSYHGAPGRADFLGLRTARSGATEIVYDDGRQHRYVWRVSARVSELSLGEALQSAVSQRRVIPALYNELRKRSIAIEAVTV